MKRTATIALCGVLFGSVALAAPKTVREGEDHLRRGVKLFDRGELDQAIVELEAAHRLNPSAATCYTLGQAHRTKGNCKIAIDFYRCAVARAPSESFARAASYQIGRCVVDGTQPSEPADPVVRSPPSQPDAAVPEPAPSASVAVSAPIARPRWHRDVAGGVLLGTGLAAAAVGAGLVGHAQSLVGDAGSGLGAYHDALDEVDRQRIPGLVALSVSGVLLVAGAIRYGVVARRK